MSDENMYVKNFDDIDFNDYDFEKPTRLDGNSYEVKFKNTSDDSGFFFALPEFPIERFNIIKVSKNGFLKLEINENNTRHQDFSSFLKEFDEWILKTFSKNYNTLFNNNQKISVNTLKKMYAPLTDDTIALRIHTRKNKLSFECKDAEENVISVDQINDCQIIPLVEIKSLFVKSRSFNVDIVLRGIVKLDKNTSLQNDRSFFEEDKDDVQNSYMDYQTDDDTLSVCSKHDLDDLDDIDIAKKAETAEETEAAAAAAAAAATAATAAEATAAEATAAEAAAAAVEEIALDDVPIVEVVAENKEEKDEEDVKAVFAKARRRAKKANEEADRLYQKLLLNMK